MKRSITVGEFKDKVFADRFAQLWTKLNFFLSFLFKLPIFIFNYASSIMTDLALWTLCVSSYKTASSAGESFCNRLSTEFFISCSTPSFSFCENVSHLFNNSETTSQKGSIRSLFLSIMTKTTGCRSFAK